MTRSVSVESRIGTKGVARFAPRGRVFMKSRSFHAAKMLSARTGATTMIPGPSMNGMQHETMNISSIDSGTCGPTWCAQRTISSR